MPPVLSAVGSGARRAWRIARWPIAAGLGLLLVLVEIAVVLVVAWPIDRRDLAPDGGPLVITDRDGVVLARLPAPGGRPARDAWVPLGELPAVAVSAVIASEDDGFWDHRGVDGRGVVRAALYNLRDRRVGYGGSTLTMQLARLLYTQGDDRSFGKKLRESVHALRLERALGKREILEQWMNRAYFGNGAWGIDAAARLYFGKPPAALSTGEAVLLACLPRAPSAYDPIRHPAAALRRRDRVLAMLVERGVLDRDAAERAAAQPLAIALHRPATRAPHFVRYVVSQLPPEVAARGGTVRTTLDARLQEILEARVREHVAGLRARQVSQAGLVVLDAESAHVLAWIGSAAWDGPDGEVDIVTRRRNPGSALKPFVYAAAIEAGDLPSTVAFDVRDVSADYFAPEAGVEHGPVRYREALGSSYNFAAIHALERAGLTRVMTALRAAGVAELPGRPEDYGLRLALGAAKVRLLDLAAGYRFAVADGEVLPPAWVISADAPDGTHWRPAPRRARRVFSPTTAWLTMDMMADPDARRPGFGDELPFDLPYRVAAKTGTARGFADTVAIAATRELIVAAWAGTFDGTTTEGMTAMRAAAPLARDALLAASHGHDLTLPPRPPTVEGLDVCAVSGLAPGPTCPVKHDHAPRDRHVHLAPCDWHQGGKLVYPAPLAGWLRRTRHAGHGR